MRIIHTVTHGQSSVLAVASVSLAGGMSLVASSGHDGTIRLWSSRHARLEPVGELLPEAGSIFSLSAHPTPDGDAVLLAGSFSRVVHAWLLRVAGGGGSGDEVTPTRLWSSRQHTGWVRALAIGSRRSAPSLGFSIGCNRILSWSLLAEGVAETDRQPESELRLFEDAARVRSHDILCLAYGAGAGAGEELLAAGSVDGAVRCWPVGEASLASGNDSGGLGAAVAERAELSSQAPARWLAHSDRVTNVLFTAGHEPRLVSAGYDGAVRRWGAMTPRAQGMAQGDDVSLVAEAELGARVHALAASAEGQLHCGVGGEVISLEPELLRTTACVALPPGPAGVGTRAAQSAPVRVTALAALPPEPAGGDCHGDVGYSATVVAGDSAGRLHVLASYSAS